MEPDLRPTALEISVNQSNALVGLAQGSRTPQALALRARIVLACAEGQTNKEIATTLGVTAQTVEKWRQRFAEHGIEGLRDAERAGAPRRINIEDLEWVLTITLLTPPSQGDRWTTRSLSAACGLSQSAISRAWRGFGLKPSSSKKQHRRNNELIRARFEDLLRLYNDPTRRAQVRVHRVQSRTGLRDWLADCVAAVRIDDRADLVLADCGSRDEDEARNWMAGHPQFTLRVAPAGKHWGELLEHWFSTATRAESYDRLKSLAIFAASVHYSWTPIARMFIESSALAPAL